MKKNKKNLSSEAIKYYGGKPPYISDDEVWERVCKKGEELGLRVFELNGEIHIRTQWGGHFYFEYFTPFYEPCILMHGSTRRNRKIEWHTQFTWYFVSVENVLQYIWEHDAAKYSGKFIKFSTKNVGKIKMKKA